ncbi:flagellar export chaperone FliS [Halalkalibacterium ligniniphilum]|uniref:flagellar export chaperone FliS n=1 Tax=Halalkalibacterium ligniniphilum TaxID=1134413 RepID=UPI00034782B5|nr:flagellar export chaperone FliS [Halalkalibacterium ligniniphilum]
MSQFLTNEAIYQKSPEELTSLLYEACYNNLEQAIQQIDEKDYVTANESLQKASDIVHRLGAGLNYEAGIVADQLDQLYNYMADKIIEANYKKDKAILQELIQLLTSIMGAWNEAMKTKQDIQPKSLRQKASVYENNVMYDN